MKKIAKNRLALRTETVRDLVERQLANIAGGVSGLRCDTYQCTTRCTDSYWPCSMRSTLPDC